MQFQKYDLGQLNSGEMIEVILSGNAANIKLMDSSNFQNYRAGRKHIFYGGYVTKSPYKIAVPNFGTWHIIIDLGGYSGKISSSVRIM